MIVIYIIALLFMAGVVFWQGSLLYASVFTVPTVYASHQAIVDACKLAGLKKGQTIVDLGCGNAKSLIIACKEFGAKGVGVENSYYCFLKSKMNVMLAGLSGRIKIIFGDFKAAEDDLAQADMVYMYLLNKTLAQIEKWFFESIVPKTQAVVLCFEFPNHKPQKVAETVNLGRKTTLKLYTKGD